MTRSREQILQQRVEVLRKQLSKMQKLNEEQFERLHESETRNMFLEQENAYLRSMR